MTGRGAWPNDGRGGTLEYGLNGTRPGPYYMLAQGEDRRVGSAGWESPYPNRQAVHGGVLAYQRALNRHRNAIAMTVEVDGVYGPGTEEAVRRFQENYTERHPDSDLSVWGGIGLSTSKALLMPLLEKSVDERLQPVVCGIVMTESGWDAGAVGQVDEGDLGLGQISTIAREEYDISREECFQPSVAFDFIEMILKSRIEEFDGQLRDAIASYNLGAAGARRWISQGRPDNYTPAGADESRCTKCYIDHILNACKDDDKE